MMLWYQAAIGFLLLIIAALSIKLYLLRKSAKEIEQEFTERILTDTNTLISISTNDRHMRKLAAVINEELRKAFPAGRSGVEKCRYQYLP